MQARGRPHAAAREVRNLLGLVRGLKTHERQDECDALLRASLRLAVLDPGGGDKGLLQAVKVELAQLERLA